MDRSIQDDHVSYKTRFANTVLMPAAGDLDVDTVQALIYDNQTDVTARNAFGYTALHWVTQFCWNDPSLATDVARILLWAGADINVKDIDGVTSLMFAAYKRCVEVVDLLLENGADTNIRRTDGTAARGVLEFPRFKGRSAKILKLLEKFGALPWCLGSAQTTCRDRFDVVLLSQLTDRLRVCTRY